jgi:hypothetical protein
MRTFICGLLVALAVPAGAQQETTIYLTLDQAPLSRRAD